MLRLSPLPHKWWGRLDSNQQCVDSISTAFTLQFSVISLQFLFSLWSRWQDLNLRPPVPQTGALPDYATSRWVMYVCCSLEKLL